METRMQRADITAPTTPEQYRAAIERQDRVISGLRQERDELAAHVGRLVNAALTEGAGPMMRKAVDSGPAANLAHVRAEAIESAADRVDEWLNESDDDPVTLIRRSAALIRSQSGPKT